MRKSDLAHDIIKVFSIWKPSIYELAAPIYQKGFSITEIASETGLKRTAIWEALRNKRDKLHPKDPVPYERWRKGHKRHGCNCSSLQEISSFRRVFEGHVKANKFTN